MNTSTPLLSAMSDSGSVVDWWFVYKVAGKAISADGTDAKGDEYVYFDAAQNGQIALSPHRISSPTDGAVANTLNQIYNNKDPNVGWFFYNDENPISGKTNGSRGHTKGVLCFNTVTNSAFWLIQSSPKFPSKAPYNYPTTAMGNAQTFLCITLKDADTARAIAQQMFVAQQPNVYLASKVPLG
ncbi:MAG: deoxyribonuclease II family protein, partial [Spirosomaceae bacterium]|nr:deoxyribonuclease II family protein [Spirosomataceae bacterium]